MSKFHTAGGADYYVPEEKFEPEIERRLTIPRLELPEFKAAIKEEDLADIAERDRKMLLAMSVLEQMLDCLVNWSLATNRHMRCIEAEQLRRSSWWPTVGKWAAVTTGAGLISGIINLLLKR